MTEAGLSEPEQARVQQAADEAFRVQTGREGYPSTPRGRVIEALRQFTVEAPLQSLAMAFLLGVLIARRR